MKFPEPKELLCGVSEIMTEKSVGWNSVRHKRQKGPWCAWIEEERERGKTKNFFLPWNAIPTYMWGSSAKLSSSAEAAPFSASSVQCGDFQRGYNFQTLHLWVKPAV